MTSWLVVPVLVGASLLTGWLLIRMFLATGSQFESTPLEQFFSCVILGVAVIGWTALLLAELGRFSTELLLSIWLIFIFTLALVAWKRQASPRVPAQPERAARQRATLLPNLLLPGNFIMPAWTEAAFLGIWLVIASWLYFRPHEFVIGGADAGVYVNLGAEISQNGSIIIQDVLLAELDPALYPAFLRPTTNEIAPFYILPAFFVVGEPPGEITPQFYPLHPVWQAIAFSMGGVRAELLMTGLWSLLGSLAIYLTVRQYAGWEVAALALAGLSINALQVWFARYPTTEALSQYLIWTGIWSFGALLRSRTDTPIWGLMAGSALGQYFLVRIDALFIMPILAAVMLWLWLAGHWRRSYGWFAAPLLIFLLHSLIHAMDQSSPYFFELFGVAINLLIRFWEVPAAAAATGAMLIIVAVRKRGRLAALYYLKPYLLIAVCSAIILLAAYGWFVRPNVGLDLVWNDPFSARLISLSDRENLIRLGWYLSPVGVWLGVAGICLLLWKTNRSTIVLLGIGLFYTIFYLWRISANPHQIYAMRRYVPAVMPLFILSAACFIGWILGQRKWWTTGAALLLAVGWLGCFGWLARGFVSQQDLKGITSQLSDIDARIAPNSVLLFNDQAPIGQGDLWGTSMRFIYGHQVFTLRDTSVIDGNQLDGTIRQWQEEGHTVYWINTPTGQSQLLPGQARELVGPYQIAVSRLEYSYDKRPTALESFVQFGEISALQDQN